MSKASLELGGTNWAAKDGNLLGYANGSFVDRYIPREFTFSRGSNLAATRINSAGKIEKGRENLLLQSNQFDTTWSNQSSAYTITSGQAGYDGTNDAWLIDKSTADNKYLTQATSVSGVFTASIYAKAGTSNSVLILCSNQNASWNLETGTLVSSFNAISTSIESVGDGWYRLQLTGNDTSIFYIQSKNSGASAAGSIYIQDAQLEQGLVATNYIESDATTATAGLLENEPRIDYTGGTPSLLLEPQRTNLMTNSEYVTGTNVNVTTSFVKGPEGLNNATRITETAVSGQHYTSFGEASVTLGTKYAISFFVKKGGYDTIKVYTQSSRINFAINFTFSTEAITGSGDDYEANSVKAEDYGNGWYRLSGVATANSTGSVSLYASPKDLSTYLGDTSKYTDYYGIQIEEGSYATSYIPTYGTSVTRNVDFANKTSASDLIGQTEGTLYLDLNITTIDSNSFLFGLYGGSPRNEIYFRGATNNRISFVHYYGSTQANIFTSIISEGRHKLAACYKNNDWVLYLDGVLVGTDTSGSFVGGMNNITFGYSSIGAYQPFESVNKAILFKTRLTNEELATLTTI